MAIINVKFDTITKDADVTLDGQKVDNVYEVEFYIYDEDGNDKGWVDVRSMEYVDEKKLMKHTRISASEQEVTIVDPVKSELATLIADSLSAK